MSLSTQNVRLTRSLYALVDVVPAGLALLEPQSRFGDKLLGI